MPDTSALVEHIRDTSSPAVQRLRDPNILNQLLIGDVVLTEMLQGARDEKDAARLEADLRQFPVVAMVNDILAAKAARYYRIMRSSGFTMSKIADLYIGTFCIEYNHDLLHCDSDYGAMERFCGLRVLR